MDHPISNPPELLRTLVDVSRFRAAESPRARQYLFLEDGEREGPDWTRADVDRKARAVAATLQKTLVKGDSALLVYLQGLDFVAALLGCAYAGVIGIPAPSPDPARLARTAPRLALIARDAGARCVLVHTRLNELHEYLPPELPGVGWIVTDLVDDAAAEDFVVQDIAEDDIAYLQYTSGSTSSPKGVILTHRNLVRHMECVQRWHAHGPGDTIVCWLPMFHDFGLVYGVLLPLYAGAGAVLFSPAAFVQKPLRWMRAVSRYRGTSSPTPNFGLDLCATKSTAEERAGLDLSGWFPMNGSEPIRLDTERRFREAFAPHGLDVQRMVHAYGLAEGTLVLSAEANGDGDGFLAVDPVAYDRGQVVVVARETPGAQLVPSSGIPTPGTIARIVDANTREPLPDGRIGEVWYSGDLVCAGYWKQEAATEETFRATLAETGEGPFLRTGDLGFLWEGRLHISGRLKDRIIVRGENHHPQDVEWTLQTVHPAFRPNCGAAFQMLVDGEERVVFVSEVYTERIGDPQEVFARAVEGASEHGLSLWKVVLLEPRTLPKTSSGKIQRSATRDLLAAGALRVITSWTASSATPAATTDLRRLLAERPRRARAMLIEHIRAKAASIVGLPPERISAERPLREQGLDSVAVVDLNDWLGAAVGVELGVAAAFEHGTVGGLADLVVERLKDTASTRD